MKWQRVKINCLFWGILFVILFILSEIIDFGVRKSDYAHYYKVNLIGDKRIDPEIAVFGSSVGEVGVQPTIIESISHKKTYNFSIDGTRFIQYRGLIEELNKNSNTCKLFIFVETFFTLSKVDQLTAADRYMAHISNDRIYESLYDVQPELTWELRYIPFYKFVAMNHSYYKASIIGLKSWFMHTSFNDPLKGYTPKYKSWEYDMDSLNKHTSPINIIIDSFAINRYRQTIRELESQGRKVMIIIPPFQTDGLKLIPNLDILRKTFASLAGKNVFFKDYSLNSLSADKSYFYNNSHLNDEGAKRFSIQLSQDINTILTSANQ